MTETPAKTVISESIERRTEALLEQQQQTQIAARLDDENGAKSWAHSLVMDEAALMELVEGDREFLGSLLDAFWEESPRLVARAAGATERCDLQEVAAAAHALKGAVSAIEGKRAFQVAQELENAAKEGNLQKVREAMRVFGHELEMLKDASDALLKSAAK